MAGGLAQDELAADADGELGPGGGFGGDGLVQDGALVDEGEVHAVADTGDGAEVLGDVGEADDVAEGELEVGDADFGGAVVEAFEEVVVVVMEEGWLRVGGGRVVGCRGVLWLAVLGELLWGVRS